MLLLSQFSYAWKVEGIISDEHSEPLSFVNVFIQGSSVGTVSNEEGYFQLQVSDDPSTLVFRYIGYETQELRLKLSDSIKFLNIQLKPRDALLQETVINAKINPADAIMRKVIKYRTRWNIEAEDYQCEVYIKGLQRAEDVPERFLGKEVEYDEFGLDSTGSGILYLFESVNELLFLAPNSYQESIRSSRVSGRNNAFSFTRASDLVLDYNRNIVPCFDMERGVASPIGGQGFFYYSYHLAGSYYEGDQKFYRIEFQPKRENDPAGTGFLIVCDSLFYTQSLQMTLYRKNQLSILDSLELHNEYQVFENHYLPVNTRLQFGLNVFNIGVTGYYFTQYLSYDFEKGKRIEKRPKMEVLRIDEGANKRDSSYWDEIRPIPLTPTEQEDYQKKDSLQAIRLLKQDSAKNDGLSWYSFIGSTTFRSADRSTRFTLRGLAQSLQFNTVEGIVFEPKLEIENYQQGSKALRALSIYSLRYGFSNTRLGGSVYSELYFQGKIPLTLWSEIVHQCTPIDGSQGITPLWNSLYSLFLAENHLKFYQRTSFGMGLNSKVANGLELSTGFRSEERLQLRNSTDFSFRKDNSTYTDNRISNKERPFLIGHYLNLLDFGLRFTPFNRYIQSPNDKIDLGSKWPTFVGKYTLGFTPEKKESIQFQKIELRMDWKVSLGILGNLNLSGQAGNFLYKRQVYAPDYFHFATNPGIYQRGEDRMLRLQTLTPYSYSTARSFGQLHLQHNFDGFLLNKLPGIRRLRAREFIGVHILAVPSRTPYYEFSFGLEQLALYKKDPGLLRIEFLLGYSAGKTYPTFRIGFTF